MKFREVCGVLEKDEWPDPDEERVNSETNEEYFTPSFDQGVLDAHNISIFKAVADLVWEDLAVMHN